MLRIAVYCEPLGVLTSGTSGRGMLKSLIDIRSSDHFVLIVRKGYEQSKTLTSFIGELRTRTNWSLHVERRSRRMVNIMALLGLSDYGNISAKADVYLNMDATDLGSSNHPLIVTVADLSVFKGREFASFQSSISFFLRKRLILDGIHHADGIVSVSRATQVDIESKFSVGQKLNEVVYNGIEQSWFDDLPNNRKNTGVEGAYWIWWGHISTRKNIEALLKAYSAIRNKADVPRLLLIYSNSNFPANLDVLIDELSIRNHISIEKHMGLSDLIEKVSFSKGLLFPSLVEGFGLPIIEAMARGIPVLTSSVSAMPEIAGKEAVFCDPHRVEDIAVGLENMLCQDMWAVERANRRKARASMFTFEKAARKYSDMIDNIYNTGRGGYTT